MRWVIPARVIAPLVLLGIAATSWALHPASRMLNVADRPAAAGTAAREIAMAGA